MKGELIGKQVVATYAKKKFEGIIIDETKNTITIKTKNRQSTIIKKEATLKINDKLVFGKEITKRPEDRIKAC